MRSNLLFLLVLLVWIGCSTREESVSFNPNLELLFSNDTVSFDTLLSERRSSTRRLTVYNPNNEAIQINQIALGNADSDYSLIINGQKTNALSNAKIFGGDSILILVEVNVTARNEDLPYLVKDSIVFSWNTNEDHVKLVSYGQDANTVASRIACDETWTNSRPYIISDTILVQKDCQLTVEKGAKVYFENNAIMFVAGTLKATGDSANHILFRNARFDGIFDQVPGQWNGIYFLEGSSDNEVIYAEIFNGQIGLRVGTPDDDDTPDLIVNNSIIYNMSTAGILAFTSDISATNTLIYNCGNYLVGGFAGGNYSFFHCTFSNEPALFVQDEPTVQFSDNVVINEDRLLTDELSLTVLNSIIWGTADEELLINNGGGEQINLVLESNIIRSNEEISNNFTSTQFNFPGFQESFSNNYQLDSLAFARNKGQEIGVDIDLMGRNRDAMPDIGAYERIDKK